MSDVNLDLFGQPVRERREGRGRPEHVWTRENSNKINLLFACGHDVKAAAEALGISVPTLRKHYFAEVDGRRVARLRLQALQLERLNDQAGQGNVTAEKALLSMVEREQMKLASTAFADKPKAPPRKGIKDQRRDDAWDAGRSDEDWGPLLHGETGAQLPN